VKNPRQSLTAEEYAALDGALRVLVRGGPVRVRRIGLQPSAVFKCAMAPLDEKSVQADIMAIDRWLAAYHKVVEREMNRGRATYSLLN